MITDAVKNKLTQFNIPEERYATEYSELSSRGYSEQQIHHLVLRKSSAVTINKLIFSHVTLVGLGFSAEQIVKIAGHNGGSKNIDAVKNGSSAHL